MGTWDFDFLLFNIVFKTLFSKFRQLYICRCCLIFPNLPKPLAFQKFPRTAQTPLPNSTNDTNCSSFIPHQPHLCLLLATHQSQIMSSCCRTTLAHTDHFHTDLIVCQLQSHPCHFTGILDRARTVLATPCKQLWWGVWGYTQKSMNLQGCTLMTISLC